MKKEEKNEIEKKAINWNWQQEAESSIVQGKGMNHAVKGLEE